MLPSISAINLNSQSQYLKAIILFFGITVGLGIVFTGLFESTLKSFSVGMLWLLACIMSGSGVGFLFGVPKVLQGSNPAADSGPQGSGSYRFVINTNLTEISDWLTKIIVGLGLVNLAKIPPYIQRTANCLAAGMNTASRDTALAFSYGLIVCYSILGFLFTYLITRLVLSKAFSEADQESIRQFESHLASSQIQLAALDLKQGVLAQAVYPTRGRPEESFLAQQALPADQQDIFKLTEMATEYLNIDVADWAERTHLKDVAANTMGNFALTENIPKAQIFDHIGDPPNEGMAIALATLMNIRPEEGDLAMLLQFAPKCVRLHVRYRIMLAIVSLFKKDFILSDRKAGVKNLLDSYRPKADPTQLRMIESTCALIS